MPKCKCAECVHVKREKDCLSCIVTNKKVDPDETCYYAEKKGGKLE